MVLKRNLFSITVISILAVILLFFAIISIFFVVKNMRIGKEIAAKSGTIDRFVQKNKMPLTENSVSFLEDERNKLKSAYSRLKLAFTSPLNEEIPPENMDSLQFKEKLIQVQKKLREEAKDFSLALPDSLSFTKYETELSEPSEIPYLLKKLRVLEELVYIMTLTGVVSLDEINFIGEDIKKAETAAPQAMPQAMPAVRPAHKGGAAKIEEAPKAKIEEAPKANIYDEITVSFKITCTYSKLIGFLYKLRASPFIFVVDDLDISKAKDTLDKDEAAESMLQAAFLVKAELIN